MTQIQNNMSEEQLHKLKTLQASLPDKEKLDKKGRSILRKKTKKTIRRNRQRYEAEQNNKPARSISSTPNRCPHCSGMLGILMLLIMFASCHQAPVEQPRYDYGEVIEFIMNTAQLVHWSEEYMAYRADESSDPIRIYGDPEEIQMFAHDVFGNTDSLAQERNFHVVRFKVGGKIRYEILPGVPCNIDKWCEHSNTIIDGELIINNGLSRYGDALAPND